MQLCACGCGLKARKRFIRFHHNKFQRGLSGPRNPMFGKTQSVYSNSMRRLKLLGLVSTRKGKTFDQFYGNEVAAKRRAALIGRRSWNRGLNTQTSARLAEIGRKISQGRIGDKNWNWKGGYSVLDYGPEFNTALKDTIKNRDCNRCVDCRTSGKILHVHHIDCNKRNNEPSNLTTLCPRCHRIRHVKLEPILA